MMSVRETLNFLPKKRRKNSSNVNIAKRQLQQTSCKYQTEEEVVWRSRQQESSVFGWAFVCKTNADE